MNTNTTDTITKTARADYERALKLLGTFTRCTHLLAALEARANAKLSALAALHAGKFATLQTRLASTEAEIRALAARHPEWFPPDDRTVKSLLGSIHAQRTTRHVVPDDEAALLATVKATAAAIEESGDPALAARLRDLIRVEESLRVEALAVFDEATLATLGIRREVTDSITVKPAKVKLGNAAKKAARPKKDEPR